jgi:hypothetical protein
MRRLLPLLAVPVLVMALSSCGSGHSTSALVGMPASKAICRLAKEGLSYRIGAGPVVKPTPDIACQPVDGPQPRVVHAQRARELVVLRATCDPTVGCL